MPLKILHLRGWKSYLLELGKRSLIWIGEGKECFHSYGQCSPNSFRVNPYVGCEQNLQQRFGINVWSSDLTTINFFVHFFENQNVPIGGECRQINRTICM